jgi:hypothetical protein
MTPINVHAEHLLILSIFRENSPESRAIAIIKGMNLRIYRDDHGILAQVAARKVLSLRAEKCENAPLRIFLEGVLIYMDGELEAAYYQKLQNRDMRWEREF